MKCLGIRIVPKVAQLTLGANGCNVQEKIDHKPKIFVRNLCSQQ